MTPTAVSRRKIEARTMFTTSMTENACFVPSSQMLTRADMIRSWYISIMYLRGRLKKQRYLKNRNILSNTQYLNTHLKQREIKSAVKTSTNRMGNRNSLASKTWVNEIDLNP